MPTPYFERLFRSVRWADLETCAALRAHPAALPEALPVLAHLLAAEHVWLSRIRGAAPALAVWPSLALEECEPLARENAAGYATFLAGRDEADLAAAVRYRNTQGQEFETPLADILTHVVTHGAYHRGQVARAIRRAGGQPVNTDFVTWVRVGDSARN
jgi:uncharacterized damage-inducible protein DinB